jgi:hypothetical protein
MQNSTFRFNLHVSRLKKDIHVIEYQKLVSKIKWFITVTTTARLLKKHKPKYVKSKIQTEHDITRDRHCTTERHYLKLWAPLSWRTAMTKHPAAEYTSTCWLAIQPLFVNIILNSNLAQLFMKWRHISRAQMLVASFIRKSFMPRFQRMPRSLTRNSTRKFHE